MQQMDGKTGRQRKMAKRNADHIGFADKDTDVVEIAERSLTRRPGSSCPSRAAASAIDLLLLGDDQQRVSGTRAQ